MNYCQGIRKNEICNTCKNDKECVKLTSYGEPNYKEDIDLCFSCLRKEILTNVKYFDINYFVKSANPLTFYSAIRLNYKKDSSRYGIYNILETELTNLFLDNELIRMNDYTNLDKRTFYSTSFVKFFTTYRTARTPYFYYRTSNDKKLTMHTIYG